MEKIKRITNFHINFSFKYWKNRTHACARVTHLPRQYLFRQNRSPHLDSKILFRLKIKNHFSSIKNRLFQKILSSTTNRLHSFTFIEKYENNKFFYKILLKMVSDNLRIVNFSRAPITNRKNSCQEIFWILNFSYRRSGVRYRQLWLIVP